MEELINKTTEEIMQMLMLGEEEEHKVKSCVTLIYHKILCYLQREDFPQQLDWVLMELSMGRYGYLGSEGLKTEDFDGGFSVSYKDVETEFNKYKKYLDLFAKRTNYRFI